MNCGEVVFVVYDPPAANLPFLSVVFVPGRENPMVTPFASATEAEEYNKQLGLQFVKETEKAAQKHQGRDPPRRRKRSGRHGRRDRDR